MNTLILARQLSTPRLMREVVEDLILSPPTDTPAQYYKAQLGIYDGPATADIIVALGFFDDHIQPTQRWQSFLTDTPRGRREQLRTAFDAIFATSDGSSTAEAMSNIRLRTDRVRWIVRHHNIKQITKANYVEHLCRVIYKTLDSAAPIDLYRGFTLKNSPLNNQRVHNSSYLHSNGSFVTSAAAPIRAELRIAKPKNVSVKLIVNMPDTLDRNVHKQILAAADQVLFDAQGHWSPLNTVPSTPSAAD